MMTELIAIAALFLLAIVIVIAMFVILIYEKERQNDERLKLVVSAIKSKDINDFVYSTDDDRKDMSEVSQTDFVPPSELSDNEFSAMIKRQIKNVANDDNI